MIESKLYQAAQSLPEPTSSFYQIEEKAYQNQSKSTFSAESGSAGGGQEAL